MWPQFHSFHLVFTRKQNGEIKRGAMIKWRYFRPTGYVCRTESHELEDNQFFNNSGTLILHLSNLEEFRMTLSMAFHHPAENSWQHGLRIFLFTTEQCGKRNRVPIYSMAFYNTFSGRELWSLCLRYEDISEFLDRFLNVSLLEQVDSLNFFNIILKLSSFTTEAAL